MALDGEGLLLGARNAPLLGDVLGGVAHADIGGRVLMGELRMRHRVEAHHRHAAHALDAGAEEDLARTHGDGAGGAMYRLHGRPAEAVDGGPADRLGQAGHHGDQLGQVQALLAFGEGAAQQQVFDVVDLDLGTLDQGAHHIGGHLVRADLSQRALIGGGEGGPEVTGDNGGLHR